MAKSEKDQLIDALVDLISLCQSEFTIPARIAMPELVHAEALIEDLI